jgi:GT2 family glycosyltransferase
MIFIVTTVHNSITHTKILLKNVINQRIQNTKIIIVDDGSNDGTSNYINDHFPEVVLIKGTGNLWWTGGINIAVRRALSEAKKADYIFTINNDCTIDDGLLKKLVKISKENKRAIVGSTEVDSNDRNRVISGVIKVDWNKGIFYNSLTNNYKILSAQRKYYFDADTLQTKGTLIPIEVFKEIGIFDQKHFPHYGSDYEFFIRAKRAGFKLVVSSTPIYCDNKRTGISDKKGRLSFKETFNLAFSRRSQINFIDHINLIRFCCPKEYKTRNYIVLIKKIFYYISRTYPISFIREYFYSK